MPKPKPQLKPTPKFRGRGAGVPGDGGHDRIFRPVAGPASRAECADDRERLPTARVAPVASRAEVRRTFDGEAPGAPTPLAQVVEELAAAATPGLMASAGPRYFGFVVGGSLWPNTPITMPETCLLKNRSERLQTPDAREISMGYALRGLAALGLLVFAFSGASGQQMADTTYRPRIQMPEFRAGEGPRVLIDAAHLNFHTADAGFLPFANLLRRDGYRVGVNEEAFTPASLLHVDILVVVNAMHAQSRDDWAPLPNLSAFTDGEIAAVEAWVREGGSLLLIADHMPLAGHAEALAAAFSIRFQNGFALKRGTHEGRITFRRSDGSLRPNAMTDGRGPGERIDSVTAFTGQAFRVDSDIGADAVLILGEGYEVLLPTVAWEFSESTARIPGAGLLQGAALQHGRGRVAVFGEAALFTAQLAGPRQVPVGMNAPIANQNYQFALNVIRWLSGRLP